MTDYKINENITAGKVLLISAEGEKLGIFSKNIALQKTYDENLDLVCINETTHPPVCKMMDYSKYKYEQKKREREQKSAQKKEETKEIQLRPQIQQHDLDVRIKKIQQEIMAGNRIKIVISFRGREVSHPEYGFTLLNKIIELVPEAEVFKQGKLEGKRIECILIKKK